MMGRKLLAVVALSGCSALPEGVCEPVTESWTFREATQDWGLAGVTATRLSAADLDGDGWPDLVASEGDAFGRDAFAEDVRKHWVLMNREAPDGGRTFVDETVASGLFQARGEDPELVGRAAMLHVFADIDNDGDLDVFSGQFWDGSKESSDLGDRSEVLLNDGEGHFTLAAPTAPHIRKGYATTGAAFTDVDGDGNVDLWMTGWYHVYGRLGSEQDRIMLGSGDGSFSSVTKDRGLSMSDSTATSAYIEGTARRPAFAAAACDLDGDGRDDLLASNYGRSWNQQWMQQDDGSFVDVARTSGFSDDELTDPSDNQFYRCWCEVNGCTPDPGPASLADGASEASRWQPGWDDQPHRQGGNTFGTVCADLDDDGDLDLLNAEIAHWWAGSASDRSQVLLNDGSGTFTRPGLEATGLLRTYEGGSWDEGDLFAAAADLDLDGDKDILIASTDYPDTRLFAFRQEEGFVFDEVGRRSGLDQPWPASLAVADFDLDGDLDVVTGSSTTRSGTPWSSHELHLYENGLEGGARMRLLLEGVSANRAGVGATVHVTVGDRTWTHRVDGGSGHMAMQHDTALTVGLDGACAADSVRVVWPGGAEDRYDALPAGHVVTLVQGGEVRVAPLPGSAPAR